MDFIIKKATIKDSDDVVKIIDFVLSNDFSAYKDKTILAYRKNIYTKKYFQEFFGNEKNIAFGAYYQNKLIGFIGLKPEPGGVILIDWLIVNELHRSKGVGSKLIDTCEKWALENKYHYLFLGTIMQRKVEFYKKHGFHILGTHKNGWFGENDIVMSKSLRDKPFEEIFKIKK